MKNIKRKSCMRFFLMGNNNRGVCSSARAGPLLIISTRCVNIIDENETIYITIYIHTHILVGDRM